MSHVEEKWEDVKDFPRYAVSSYGRVINQETGRELARDTARGGYVVVRLWKNGRGTKYFVQRLVAEAFFLNYEEGRAVQFVNGDFQDCSVLNLTLSTKGCRKREINA